MSTIRVCRAFVSVNQNILSRMLKFWSRAESKIDEKEPPQIFLTGVFLGWLLGYLYNFLDAGDFFFHRPLDSHLQGHGGHGTAAAGAF